MSRKHRLPDYIDHIISAASDAISFTEDMSFEQFEIDRKAQLATVMSLIIVGEASSKIVERFANFVAENPGLPWQEMRGMRNRIVHGYSDINLAIVYQTVKSALPLLIEQLGQLKFDE